MKTIIVPYFFILVLFVYAGNALAELFEGDAPYNNTFLGIYSGDSILYGGGTGINNTMLGYEAGGYTETGSSNIFIGTFAGTGNVSGDENVYIGADIGFANTSGNQNTIIGNGAGLNLKGSGNVFIGYNAGKNETVESNKLFIENSDIGTPLIYGEFDNDIVTINGKLGLGTAPLSQLTVSGDIELINGGQIKFPDGTFQTTAGEGDITGVTAGTGLTGGGTTGAVSLNINFSGSGVASTASRSDHTHTEADITSGTVDETRIDPDITRDSEIMPTVLANDGNASGVDADLFDGMESSSFMSAGTDNWVDTTGDTMNGDLLVYGIVDIDQDLYLVGNMYLESDENAKKDIMPIRSSLEKINNIRGISFSWKDTGRGDRKSDGSRHYGVIAQEVEKVLPELVTLGNNGMKKVAYIELIPVLVEAVKEQQQIITDLSEKVSNLERELKLRGSVTMVDSDYLM